MHAIHHLPGHLESHLTTISCTNCKKHSLIIYLLINVFLWQFTLLININAFFIVWTHGAAVRQDDWIWLMQLSPGNAYNFCVHVQRSSFFQKTDWMMLGICSPFCPCYLFSLLSCLTFFRACQEVSRSCCLTFSLWGA